MVAVGIRYPYPHPTVNMHGGPALKLVEYSLVPSINNRTRNQAQAGPRPGRRYKMTDHPVSLIGVTGLSSPQPRVAARGARPGQAKSEAACGVPELCHRP